MIVHSLWDVKRIYGGGKTFLHAVLFSKHIDNTPFFSYNSGMKRLALREKRGAAACLLGIFCNLLLSAGKIAAGLLTGFVSVTADGFNNLSDCGSGIVALVSFFISDKPADKQHPFGHRRAEYIAALITGFFVLFLAAELVRECIGTVVRGSAPEGSWPVYLVLAISILAKVGMFLYYRTMAKKLDAGPLKAAATDCLCDSVATASVLAGTLLCGLAPAADGWMGILVSVFIAWQGIKILREAVSELLGQAPDPGLAEQIKNTILASESVLGVHDLQIYSYGKGVSFATIHAEMDAGLTMLAAHTVIDEMETRIQRETGVLLTVHIDPVDLANPEESSLKVKIWEAARGLTDGLELHDLRLVHGVGGTDTLKFDVGIPYACKLTDEELHRALVSIVKEFGEYEPVIRIERE